MSEGLAESWGGEQDRVATLLQGLLESRWITVVEIAGDGLAGLRSWPAPGVGDHEAPGVERRALARMRDLPADPDPALGDGDLVVPLTGGGRRAAWVLTRAPWSFTTAELDLARLLAPGLRQQWNLERLRRDGVTTRELEVLSLVARGLTASAVARRCRISARTVHKHLENTYGKLGCHDRLTAVLILQDAGLLTA